MTGLPRAESRTHGRVTAHDAESDLPDHAAPHARLQAGACRHGAVMALALFAGIRVRELGAARTWYERLLGEPSFFPNEREAVWTLADERSVYIEENPQRAGGALITVWVDDLDAVVAEIASRGLEPDERETYDNGVRKIIYRDDEGNELGFAGAPASTEP